MEGKANRSIRALTWRRIVVKSVIFAIWAIGMLAIALQGGQELSQNTFFYLLFAIVVVWAVSTVRDFRRLRRANVDD